MGLELRHHGLPAQTLGLLALDGAGGEGAGGGVLVHNRVRPRKTLSCGGFRAWTQPLDETLEECPCKWAGQNVDGHLKHYRKKRAGQRA